MTKIICPKCHNKASADFFIQGPRDWFAIKDRPGACDWHFVCDRCNTNKKGIFSIFEIATYWFITFGIPVIIFFFLLAFFCEYFGSTLAIILYIIFAMIIMLVNFCVVSDMFLRSRVLHYMQE